MTRELLQQALEALERNVQHKYPLAQYEAIDLGQKSISAIRAHLAQPQGEPAWHDAPTVPGLWFLRHSAGVEAHMIEQEHLGETMIGDWYGPVPEDAP